MKSYSEKLRVSFKKDSREQFCDHYITQELREIMMMMMRVRRAYKINIKNGNNKLKREPGFVSGTLQIRPRCLEDILNHNFKRRH